MKNKIATGILMLAIPFTTFASDTTHSEAVKMCDGTYKTAYGQFVVPSLVKSMIMNDTIARANERLARQVDLYMTGRPYVLRNLIFGAGQDMIQITSTIEVDMTNADSAKDAFKNTVVEACARRIMMDE